MHGKKTVTAAWVREQALALPGVVEGTSYGTPCFRAGKRLFARFHQNGEDVVVRADLDRREVSIEAAPEVFHVTDHYLAYSWMLVRMKSASRKQMIDTLYESRRYEWSGIT